MPCCTMGDMALVIVCHVVQCMTWHWSQYAMLYNAWHGIGYSMSSNTMHGMALVIVYHVVQCMAWHWL